MDKRKFRCRDRFNQANTLRTKKMLAFCTNFLIRSRPTKAAHTKIQDLSLPACDALANFKIFRFLHATPSPHSRSFRSCIRHPRHVQDLSVPAFSAVAECKIIHSLNSASAQNSRRAAEFLMRDFDRHIALQPCMGRESRHNQQEHEGGEQSRKKIQHMVTAEHRPG